VPPPPVNKTFLNVPWCFNHLRPIADNKKPGSMMGYNEINEVADPGGGKII